MKKKVLERLLSGVLAAVLVFTGLSLPEVHAEESANTETHAIVAESMTSMADVDSAYFTLKGDFTFENTIELDEGDVSKNNIRFASLGAASITFTTKGVSTITVDAGCVREDSNSEFTLINAEGKDVYASSSNMTNGLVLLTNDESANSAYDLAGNCSNVYVFENIPAGTYTLTSLGIQNRRDVILFGLTVVSAVEAATENSNSETETTVPAENGNTEQNNSAVTDNTPSISEGTVKSVYVLNAAEHAAFADKTKADGEEEKFGTDNYFTLIYSTKSKVDSSNKEFEDGFKSSTRFNLGGKATTGKNSVKFTTTTKNAEVKVWWAEGGDDNRQIAILDKDGNAVTKTEGSRTKNAAYLSTLTLENPGTYYLGGDINNNYIFKVEVTESVTYAWVDHEYVLDATSDLTAFAAKAKKDGEEEKAGTDNYFTAVYSEKSKVDSSSKSFSDGYSGTQRINFGGKATTEKNSVKFTTTSDNASVKIWWAEGGDDNRQQAILDASGNVVTRTDETLAKNAVCISTLTLSKAGTYYLGGEKNNNYIFKIVVTEKKLELVDGVQETPERVAFETLSAPVISDISAEGTKVSVKVKALVGFDGADGFVVTMTDSNGKETTVKSTKECEENTVSFTLSKSGKYSFTAHIFREDTDDVIKSEPKEFDFVLPLTAPVVKTAGNAGNGSIALEWNAVAEATGYLVSVDGTNISLTTEKTEAVVEGLTVGEKAVISIVALRNSEQSAKASVEVLVEKDAERVWGTSRFGTSINTNNNGVTGSVKDGKVTVFSESGKGKIVPGSTDGLTFHYTVIDPETENFTLRAKVHVDSWTLSNGQEGFGLMVADAVGKDGDTTTFWNNSIQLIASKIEYNYDGEAVTNDTNASKISMKLGLGTLSRLGVTAEDVKKINSGAITMPENFVSETTTLETSAAAKGTGTYNLIGNYKGTEPTGCLDTLLTDFVLEIQRNNTGYVLRYLNEAGEILAEKLIYDLERTALTQLDSDKIYVGFFAARNARITVTDIELTTIAPADDEAAEEREIEYISPVCNIESATVANSEDYTLTYYSNFDGKVTITGKSGVIADGIATKAGEKLNILTKLSLGDNEFSVSATPNADYVPGEFKQLTSYETISFSHVVNYKTIAGDNIYVAPDGKADAKGTKADPVDIYTAVKYVAAGQKIILAGGKYDLTATIKVERGINGTADSLIYMIAAPDAKERPVFDFGGNCAGAVFAGDYWYFKGFDVTGSADAQKGIQVSGSHNVLDQVNAYKNGNTGIQISRYRGTDEYDQWPSYNLILNCSSYLNADKGYEDADGFAAKLTVADGNVFDGCISAYNADDGWDLYTKVQTGNIGTVTIKNCVAFRNGYVLRNEAGELDINGKVLVDAGNGNGFKMGGESLSGHHTLINSVAFENKAKGFDSNSCPDIEVYNSTAFNNESYNVAFYTNTALNTAFKAEGIISYKNSNQVAEQLKFKGTQAESNVKNASNYLFDGSKSTNTDGVQVSEDWFVSLDTSVALEILSERNADGTINMRGLLELKDTAGVSAGAVISGNGKASEIITVTEEKETPSTTGDDKGNSTVNNENSQNTNTDSSDEKEQSSDSREEKPASAKPEEIPGRIDDTDVNGDKTDEANTDAIAEDSNASADTNVSDSSNSAEDNLAAEATSEKDKTGADAVPGEDGTPSQEATEIGDQETALAATPDHGINTFAIVAAVLAAGAAIAAGLFFFLKKKPTP